MGDDMFDDDVIENKTYDIIGADGVECGVAYDTNPVQITSNEQCLELLLKLKTIITNDTDGLLDICIKVLSSTDGDDVEFGPSEIISLAQLAMENPDSVR